MNDDHATSGDDLRPGEVAVALPSRTDASVYFIGTIRTPWRTRRECPKRGAPDGPICSIVVDERWRAALTDLAGHRRIQVLYWMHRARRDLVLQKPMASSIVELVSIDGTTVQVRGLDCLDGTPLLDLKPERGISD
jgi:tRNA (Thr-GGU) A37 N-methylase